MVKDQYFIFPSFLRAIRPAICKTTIKAKPRNIEAKQQSTCKA